MILEAVDISLTAANRMRAHPSSNSTLYAGTRPTRQWRRRPAPRASSIQPSTLAAYMPANASVSARSCAGSMSPNKYVALPGAENATLSARPQLDMQSWSWTSNSMAFSLSTARKFTANLLPPSPSHVEQTTIRCITTSPSFPKGLGQWSTSCKRLKERT